MLEIKILFKGGNTGYFTSINEEEPTEESIVKLRELIRNAKQQAMRGSFELKELNTGYLTVIDVEQVATFGTRLVDEKEVIVSKKKRIRGKRKKKSRI